MNELEARVALTVARKFTPLGLTNLLKRFGSAAAVVSAPVEELRKTPKVNRNGGEALKEVIRTGAHLREMEQAEQAGIRLVMLEDELYPEALKRIDDPPPLLYVLGDLTADDALAFAIVGGRNASYYGTAQAARFARDMAQRGVTVVSGLARGVDTSAHRTAVQAGGRTIAVVGSGLLNIYPPENRPFISELLEGGAVISEFPLETPGVARNFPQRNRLISGLSLGILVVEATLRSGSLITARLAAEQGREVFALPGKVDSELSAGPNELIRQGAQLVTSPADIYEELPALKGLPPVESEERPSGPAMPRNLTPIETSLWKSLKPSDGQTPDELAAATKMTLPQVNSGLMLLEMKQYIKQLPGKRYVRLDF
jgi:DNA processing protein